MNGGPGVGGIYPHACAACKLQRKTCDESCEFAPYFPASRYDEFLHAYNLFGLSNIARMLNLVQPHQRQVTAETLLFEGNVRFHIDPVHGCLGIIQKLHSLIGYYESELEAVNNQQQAFFRGNYQQQFDNSILSSFSTPPPPLQLVHDRVSRGVNSEEAATTSELSDTHDLTDQIMDLKDWNEITSVPSDTEGEQQSGEPDDQEAKKNGA